jgi:hypothetical protein
VVNQQRIPLPDKSGSDGLQIEADTNIQELVPATSIAMPMADVITGLASSNSRAFGGEVASALIAGVASQMSNDLRRTQAELSSERIKAEASASDLANERVKSAVLSERLHAFQATRHIKNVGVAVGSLLLGTGVQLSRTGNAPVGIISAIIGALLILISWVSVPRGGDK